jgi:UDP-N-acetylmuramyl pentapeptide phosphotransferase/UDP-N-acetylglucosamine-1-phosphate transferase
VFPILVPILYAAACLIAAAAGVAAFTRWATRARLLDVPNARSSHHVPTPRGAGAIIVLIVVATIAWVTYAGLFEAGIGIAATALGIAAISAVDDVRPLPSSLRLLVHFGCAGVAVLAVAHGSRSGWPVPAGVLATLWVVGLTNAYNFMDGIDGISGAQALVSGVTVSVASAYAGLSGHAAVGMAIAAASAGFLLHNWPPARVFMGDVGSAFLGFLFAVLALQIGAVSFSAGAAVAVSLWPFLFDTTLTLIRRTRRRENIFASHRSHLYQRLVIAGWSHARVTLTYAAMAAIGAAAALAWSVRGASWHVLIIVPMMALAIHLNVLRTEVLSSRAGNPVTR